MSTYQISLEDPLSCLCKKQSKGALALEHSDFARLPSLPGDHLCQAPVPNLTHQESTTLDLEVKGEMVEKSVLDRAGAVLCI